MGEISDKEMTEAAQMAVEVLGKRLAADCAGMGVGFLTDITHGVMWAHQQWRQPAVKAWREEIGKVAFPNPCTPWASVPTCSR